MNKPQIHILLLVNPAGDQLTLGQDSQGLAAEHYWNGLVYQKSVSTYANILGGWFRSYLYLGTTGRVSTVQPCGLRVEKEGGL